MDPKNTPETPQENGSNRAGSDQIISEDHQGQMLIGGFGVIRPRYDPNHPGPVSQGVSAQVTALQDAGVLDAKHAGMVALAVATAHEIDRETLTGGKAYGKAQLISALNAILENLPELDANANDLMDKALSAILSGDE